MKTMLIACVLSVILFACKKEMKIDVGERPPQNQAVVATITKEVAEILQQVYADHKAYMEVNAAIYRGTYEDERVPLKDLLKCDTCRFRRKFCEIIEQGKYPIVSSELSEILKLKKSGPAIINQNLVLDDSMPSVLSPVNPISIYFPYSENFGNAQIYDTLPPNSKLAIVLKPTLVYTDRESDAAPGKKPFYCPGITNSLCYTDVMVTDAYAQIYPTHIVTFGAVLHSPSSPEILKTDIVTRAYHGASRLTKQMDKLVSFTGNGGGSEIKVCRINGFLKMADEQITDFAGDVITLYYTRADISKKRWKRGFIIWDPNWNYQDIEQVYAVYEDDNAGSKTFNGTLTTTINLPGKTGKVEGEVGFKVGIMSQDEIITQRKLDRKSYLRDGLNNQGSGFIDDANDFLPTGKDWPILDGGSIWSYTFPFRIY